MAQEIAFDLFDTGIGPCGVAWTDRGLVRLQLPESDRPRTIHRLKAKSSATWIRETPSAMVRHVIEEVERHFSGSRPDFSSAELDLTGVGSFERDVYVAARSIAWGCTATYGELAALVGRPAETREVGQALAQNPIPIIIPCHRILAKGNRIGGFSAHGGRLTKERLLALEGFDLEGDAPSIPGLLPKAW